MFRRIKNRLSSQTSIDQDITPQQTSQEKEEEDPNGLPGHYRTPDGGLMMNCFPQSTLQRISTMTTTADDICIASFPRSGATFVEEIVRLLRPEFTSRAHVLEYSVEGDDTLEAFLQKPPPRTFRTHLPLHYYEHNLKKGNLKVIFVVRNIKDVLVSFYGLYMSMKYFEPTTMGFEEFARKVHTGELAYGHLNETMPSWLAMMGRGNFHLVRYEDLKENGAKEVGKIATFCGTTLSENECQDVAEKAEFEALKKSPSLTQASFNTKESGEVNLGDVGIWQKFYSPTLLREIEDRTDCFYDYRYLYPRHEEQDQEQEQDNGRLKDKLIEILLLEK